MALKVAEARVLGQQGVQVRGGEGNGRLPVRSVRALHASKRIFCCAILRLARLFQLHRGRPIGNQIVGRELVVNIPAASDDTGDAQKSEDQDREATFGETTNALAGRWVVRALRLRRRWRWRWCRRRKWRRR